MTDLRVCASHVRQASEVRQGALHGGRDCVPGRPCGQEPLELCVPGVPGEGGPSELKADLVPPEQTPPARGGWAAHWIVTRSSIFCIWLCWRPWLIGGHQGYGDPIGGACCFVQRLHFAPQAREQTWNAGLVLRPTLILVQELVVQCTVGSCHFLECRAPRFSDERT